MSKLHMYVGNRNYSSWSLRPWLVLKRSGLEFETTMIPLRTNEFREKIKALSPSGLVPVLHTDGITINDSLAISEFVAEHVPAMWPSDPLMRALARSNAAAMHSGFFGIRSDMPMSLKRNRPNPSMADATKAEISKVDQMWQGLIDQSSGPFLFGQWSIADAFWTPVATRFRSYQISVSAQSQAYCDRLLAEPEFLEWERQASLETDIIPEFDA